MAQRLDHATRREQIIEATLGLLADTPLAALHTRQVARAVGVSQPALFRHFRSREALLLAVLEHAQLTIGGSVARALEAVDGAWPRLEAVACGLMGFVERHPGLPRLLFGEAASEDHRLRAGLNQLVSMQQTLARELVRAGQAGGELRADVDPHAAATLFVGMLQGVVVQWRLDGKPPGLPGRVLEPLAVLRRCLHVGEAAPDPARQAPPGPPPRVTGARHLDVRPLLAAGTDPLSEVLAALGALAPGSLLAVTAPFRPRPLVALLGSAGHRVIEHPLEGGAWSVVVVVEGGRGFELLELRDREPPEPLEAVLEATAALAPGGSVRAWVPRFPRFLLGHLQSRGLTWEIVELPDGSALLHVERAP